MVWVYRMLIGIGTLHRVFKKSAAVSCIGILRTEQPEFAEKLDPDTVSQEDNNSKHAVKTKPWL